MSFLLPSLVITIFRSKLYLRKKSLAKPYQEKCVFWGDGSGGGGGAWGREGGVTDPQGKILPTVGLERMYQRVPKHFLKLMY